MDVMIFGATCAPSISQYVKNYNADKFLEEFPLAAKAIKQNHYVDDLLCSIDTAEEAIKLVKDVCFVHRQAGFNIRNWVSNSREVRNAFASTLSEKVKCINFKAENSVEKVLGVFWEHDEDVITFKIASWLLEGELLSTKKAPTKREMLRLVMSIYDPLGLIGHIVMFVKVLMQEVWRSKSGWDEPIHHELAAKWSHWLRILPDIENLKIERCYLKTFHNYEGVNVQLHTFVDASKDGYAAVCYLRLKKNADVVCSLVTAKTRVAPIKITSVPRLELMAALIGARLAKFVLDNHEIGISKKYFWSDSKTVLSWINSDHRKYNQFVAFRVTEILELSSISDWNWVPSRENVADDATKWSKIPNFSDSSRWFHGPAFLFQPEEMWPQKTGFSVVHVQRFAFARITNEATTSLEQQQQQLATNASVCHRNGRASAAAPTHLQPPSLCGQLARPTLG
uniref:Reverse transcriptase domain-containing protein n=1 Tax=Stomoxys calcitrans TaxID=35570 RepID=A0A1I8P672_STOCA